MSEEHDRSGQQDRRGEEQDQRGSRMSERGRAQDVRGEEQDHREELVEVLKRAGDAASHGPAYRATIVGVSILLALVMVLGVAFVWEVETRNDLEEIRDVRADADRQELKRIVSRLDECTIPPEQRIQDGEVISPDDCYQRGQDRGVELIGVLLCYIAEVHGLGPPEGVACES